MSYENLPDARPMSVRLVLGPMPKAMAVAITTGLVGLCAAALAGLSVYRKENAVAWGTAALLTGVLAVQYVIAISWSDYHKAWPRRRSRHRRRAMR